MTAAEPISVRVARLKGCEPRWEPRLGGFWHCVCRDRSHHRTPGDPTIDYLTPAASFALLSEMVERLAEEGSGAQVGKLLSGRYYCDAGGSLRGELTLAIAIANAYLARKGQP